MVEKEIPLEAMQQVVALQNLLAYAHAACAHCLLGCSGLLVLWLVWVALLSSPSLLCKTSRRPGSCSGNLNHLSHRVEGGLPYHWLGMKGEGAK